MPGVLEMNKVVMYCTRSCQYCQKAEKLLLKKGAVITKIDIEGNKPKIKEMIKKSKRNTVPQIFIADKHIGGFDELATLEVRNKLDKILGLP